MVFLFGFCLFYILSDRHRKIVPPPMSNADLLYNHPTKTAFVGFSDYRFILSLIILILLGLMAIPIWGLTAFHIYLIAQGRTTNEQVTGKYRIQNDVFNQGCWKNFLQTFCQPLYPQLKAPKTKRYNVELFEQMAYGKIKSKVSVNGSESKKKIPTEDNGMYHDRPNIQVNPINERGKTKGKTRFNQENVPFLSTLLVRSYPNASHISPAQVNLSFLSLFRSSFTSC